MVAEASQRATLTPELLCILHLVLKIPFEIISLKEMYSVGLVPLSHITLPNRMFVE